MAKQLSSLNVSLLGNIGGLTSSLNAGVKGVQGFVGKISSAGSSLLKFTGIAGAVSGGIAAIGSVTKGFKLASEFEQVQVSIETMLGSADAASKVMATCRSSPLRPRLSSPSLPVPRRCF